MNITRLNFTEVMPRVLELIKNSNYVSIDLQMSGIILPNHPEYDPSLSDSIQTRYIKTKQRIEKFIPVQMGMCFIEKKPQQKIVKYYPLNFYLYPSFGQSEAQEFVFNSESMRFLSKNSYDFNKLFYEGIPYINSHKLRQLDFRKQYQKLKKNSSQMEALQSPDVKSYLDLSWNRVIEWLALPQDSPTVTEEIKPNQFNYKTVVVNIRHVRAKAYMFLIKKIKKQYPTLALDFCFLDSNLKVVESQNSTSIIRRCYLKISRNIADSQTINGQQNTDPQKKQLPLINDVIQGISKARLPLLLHNGYLDLMHIYNRFVDKLPSEERLYRQRVHQFFPNIIDTKYICNSNPIICNKLNMDTSLGKCYQFFRNRQNQNAGQQQYQSVIDDVCSQYTFDSQSSHEAGFDALMTAYNFVGSMRSMHKPISKIFQPEFISNQSFYTNKIPLGNIKIPYNLSDSAVIQSYTSQSGSKFHFKSLSSFSYQTDSQNLANKIPVSEEKIAAKILITSQSLENIKHETQKHFLLKYGGGIKFLWKGEKQAFSFTLSFIDSEAEENFLMANFLHSDNKKQQKKQNTLNSQNQAKQQAYKKQRSHCLYHIGKFGSFLVTLEKNCN